MKKKDILLFTLLFIPVLGFSQDINITGIVVNSKQVPVSCVLVSLKSNPDCFCYTNENGEFTLTYTSTSISVNEFENNHIMKLDDGSLLIQSKGKSFSISINDVLGRKLKRESFNKGAGNYKIFPQAYLKQLPEGIYIISISAENGQKSFKYANFGNTDLSAGITLISEEFENNAGEKKNLKADEDSIILRHDSYKIKKVHISNTNTDVGTLELENFGNYTPAVNMPANKATLYPEYGTFLSACGKDTSNYFIQFDAYSTSEDELKIRAIPVEEFDFLPSSLSLVSGIHLEPSGTKFAKPAFVDISLNGIESTDNLLVFLYDSERDKVCYLPYEVFEASDDNHLQFYINHFSDLGVADSDNPASVFELTPEEIPEDGFVDSDDAVSFIKYKFILGHEVTDEVFEVWYNSVIRTQIDMINDIETFYSTSSDFGTMAVWAQHTNNNLEEMSFYNEATTKLSEKAGEMMDQINTECVGQTDECLIREIAKIGYQLVGYTQSAPWIDNLSKSDICSGLSHGLVDKITYDNGFISLSIDETKHISYKLLNLDLEEVTATVSFESEDPSVAEVDEFGNVTGNKEGLTKIFIRHCELEIFVVIAVGEEAGAFCKIGPPPEDSVYYAFFSFRAEEYNPPDWSDTLFIPTSYKKYYAAFFIVNMSRHEYLLYFKIATLSYVPGRWHSFSGRCWSYGNTSFADAIPWTRRNPLVCDNSGFYYTKEATYSPNDPEGCTPMGCIFVYPQAGIAKIPTIEVLPGQYMSPQAPLKKLEWSPVVYEGLFRSLRGLW